MKAIRKIRKVWDAIPEDYQDILRPVGAVAAFVVGIVAIGLLFKFADLVLS